jgi:hypothetical protein
MVTTIWLIPLTTLMVDRDSNHRTILPCKPTMEILLEVTIATCSTFDCTFIPH